MLNRNVVLQRILSFSVIIPGLAVIPVVLSCSDEGTSDNDTVHDGDSENSNGSDSQNTDSDTLPGGGSDSVSVAEPVECAVAGDNQTTLVFTNHCDDALTFEGSNIESGLLQHEQSECRTLGSASEAISAIRFWGYIGENPGGEHHTLAEMTLNTDFYDFDWYNISHVDAFNLPMAIIPLEKPECRSLVCAENLLSDCPDEGKFYLNEILAACISPDRNNPDSVVVAYFDAGCEDAYSWSGDDADSVATCVGEDYAITFCP